MSSFVEETLCLTNFVECHLIKKQEATKYEKIRELLQNALPAEKEVVIIENESIAM